MAQQVATREKVEEARRELMEKGVVPSADRIIQMIGGSKPTVLGYIREIEGDLARSRKEGADLPPELLTLSVDAMRSLFHAAMLFCDRRHEEERQQFRSSLKAHLAEKAMLEDKLNASVAECVGHRSERIELQERCAALEEEHRSQHLHETEQAARLLDARTVIDHLQGDLRQLRDYQRIAILLEQVDAPPTKLEQTVTTPRPTHPEPEKRNLIECTQLDIEAHLAAT